MVVQGLTGEQGNEDADFLKGDEGSEGTPDNTGQEATPPASEQGDPAAKESPASGSQGDELRAELVKRFGEKSDQEYLAEVWKSYRNGETMFSQTQEKAKELESLVSQFGGAEVLRRALETPVTPATAGDKPAGQYPAKVQPLIDQGLLDPNDPIAQLLIDQERRLEQSQQFVGQATHESAVKTFDTWLKDVSEKYAYADIDVIRDMGFKGAFANMNDAQAHAKINEIAARQQARVQGLIDSKTQAKLDELKELDKGKVLTGKPGGGKPSNLTAKEAFNREYDKHLKGDE